jgi:hypothetical protein
MTMMSRFVGCFVGCFLVQSATSPSLAQSEETILTSFMNPEDMLDIAGTRWILVSEFGGVNRDSTGELSLLDTTKLEKVRLDITGSSAGRNTSFFADPLCEPLDTIAPHGLDGRDMGDGISEIAVVNHFAHESIEFYSLDTTYTVPKLLSMGCLRLPGDTHNDVSFDEKSLAVTLWYKKYLGIFGRLSYLTNTLGIFGGSGELRIVGQKGTWKTRTDNLKGANGVLNLPDRIFVSQLGGLRGAGIAQIDPITGSRATVSALTVFNPDNLVRDSATSFLVTTRDSSIINGPLGRLLGIASFCRLLQAKVIRFDWEQDIATVLYSRNRSLLGPVTVSLIKDNVLYLGTVSSGEIIRVANFQSPAIR